MKNKRNIGIAYIIALPAMLLLFVFKTIPFFNVFILPFKHNERILFNGVKNAPWVGFSNFSRLFNMFDFKIIIRNTLIMNLQYIIISAVIAFILAISINSIKSSKARYSFCLITLIPFVIPSSIYGIAFFDFFGNNFIENMIEFPIRIIYAIFQSIKMVGIPVTIAVITANMNSTREISSRNKDIIKTISIFSLIQFTGIFSTNFEIINLLYTPYAYEKADNITMYSFRTNFMNVDIGQGATLFLLRLIAELILAGVVLYIISKHFKKYILSEKSIEWGDYDDSNDHTYTGYILPGIYSIGIIGFLIYIAIKAFTVNCQWNGIMTKSIIVYFFIFAFTSLFCALLSLLLAYPMTIKGISKKVYIILLLPILIAGNKGIHEFLYFKQLGKFNTYFPIIITGMFSIISIFALAGVFNSKYNKVLSDAVNEGMGEGKIFSNIYFRNMMKPTIGIAALQFLYLWGSYYSSLVYIAQSNRYAPSHLIKNMMIGQLENSPYMLALITIIIPVAVLIFLGKYIISDILVAKIR